MALTIQSCLCIFLPPSANIICEISSAFLMGLESLLIWKLGEKCILSLFRGCCISIFYFMYSRVKPWPWKQRPTWPGESWNCWGFPMSNKRRQKSYRCAGSILFTSGLLEAWTVFLKTNSEFVSSSFHTFASKSTTKEPVIPTPILSTLLKTEVCTYCRCLKIYPEVVMTFWGNLFFFLILFFSSCQLSAWC